MKIDPSWIQMLGALAAFTGALAAFTGAMYAVITRPLLAYMSDMRGDIKALRDDLLQFKTEVRADLTAIRAEQKNQGERLARVEERLPPPLVHR